MQRGFPLSEIDSWNTGSLIDWASEYDRMQRIQRGETVHDDYERYQTLKAMQPQIEKMHAAGEIKEYKYKQYCETLRNCEEKLRG